MDSSTLKHFFNLNNLGEFSDQFLPDNNHTALLKTFHLQSRSQNSNELSLELHSSLIDPKDKKDKFKWEDLKVPEEAPKISFDTDPFEQPHNTTTAQTTTTTTDPTLTGPAVDGILSGSKWNFSTTPKQLTFSFYEDTVFNGSYYGSETGVKEVSEGVKNNVRSIFNWLKNVINVDFVEVTESANKFGSIRFMLSNGPSYAYAYYPSTNNIGGDVHLNPNYDRLGDTNGFQNPAGLHGYMSLVHEIGHALGLKHPQDGSVNLSPEVNNTTNTVMTYNFTGKSAGTYMDYDIKALQSLYGARDYNSTNTTYQFTTRVDQYSVGGQLFLNTPNLTKQTVWDSGGVDTLDFSQLSADSTGYRFDLNPGGMLTAKSAYNGTVYQVNSTNYYTTTYGTEIAYNVLIENVVNSSSNDEIFANSVANTFKGYSPTRSTGNDIIWNTTSADTIDLSAYSAGSVTQKQSGNDLVLTLGTNGTITVKNYYQGNTASLLLNPTTTAPTTTTSTTTTPTTTTSTSTAPISDTEPTISINNVTKTESNPASTKWVNNFDFTVGLSQASDQSISVGYATADGLAIAGSDYMAKSGTLTFNPGETSKTLRIPVYNDKLLEKDENFIINLSKPTNAILNVSQGVGTIVNDDLLSTTAQSSASLPWTNPEDPLSKQLATLAVSSSIH